jgi:hypothetical protein
MVRAASVICALALSVVVMGTIHLVLCICATRKQKSKGGSRAGTAKEWRYYVFWLIGILAAAGCLSYGMTSDTLIRRSGIAEGFPLWWIKLCLLNTGAFWCVLGVSETLCVHENRVARVDLRR